MTELTLSPDEFGRMSAADHHAAWAIMPVSKAGTVKESPFAPLHTFGLSVDYNSFPGLTANLRTAFLYHIDRMKRGRDGLLIGLKYQLLKY